MAGVLDRFLAGVKAAFHKVVGTRSPGKLASPSQQYSSPQGGHAGKAIGSLYAPDLSPANKANWKKVTAEFVDAFVYDGKEFIFHSTNVGKAKYYIDSQEMLVEYKARKGRPARGYLYFRVTEEEAISMARAESKGIFIWDFFRVRGSQTEHQKDYVRLY